MESTGGEQSVGYDLAGASVGAFFSCHVKRCMSRGGPDLPIQVCLALAGLWVRRWYSRAFWALSLVEDSRFALAIAHSQHCCYLLARVARAGLFLSQRTRLQFALAIPENAALTFVVRRGMK
jgi:hypothetical protein